MRNGGDSGAPGKLSLLLAEDNPHVRELLENALRPLAAVQVATDGADALLRVAEKAPDLVLADFTLPSLDGLRLIEKLRSREGTRGVCCVLMAPRNDLEQISAHARELAEEIIEKPFLLGDAVAAVRRQISRIELQRAIESAPAAQRRRDTGEPAPESMRGRLSQFSLVDLLQALELGGKSCRIRIRSAAGEAEIAVERGAVIYASSGHRTGEDAVFTALAWPEGDFELEFNPRPSATRNVERGTQALLMEGVRMLDESRHGSSGDDILEEF